MRRDDSIAYFARRRYASVVCHKQLAENLARIGAMLRYESSPCVQHGCGSRLAWHRFRRFSKRYSLVVGLPSMPIAVRGIRQDIYGTPH